MRLIDADELKKTLLEYNYATEHNQIFRYIDEQPTAYDIDKVVEQLEEEKEYSDADYEAYAEERGLDAEDDWHYSGLKRAIEIVMAGGIDE